MGKYDSVWIMCPKCNHENEFQSKSGDCDLTHYSIENAPDNVLININRHSPIECDECGCKYKLEITTKSTIVVE
jgi:transcription elongation factor Elf1